MSFDTEVLKQGRGRAIRVDVSLDNFATVAHRYSDVAGELDGTNMYSARVVEMGSVKRAFGNNRIAASSTTSLRLANPDGAVDWICGRENIADAARARFRIYVVLYEAGAAATSGFTAKMLGEFVLSSWPTQNNTAVDLQLADDFMGKLGAGLLLPTFVDWIGIGTLANNPFKRIEPFDGLPSSVSLTTPFQLAFGEDFVRAWPHLLPVGNNSVGETYHGKVIVPLYCTTDLSPVDQNLVIGLFADRFPEPDGRAIGAPSEIYWVPKLAVRRGPADVQYDTWVVEKSPTITKNGIDFQIVYLVVRDDFGWTYYDGVLDVPGLAESNIPHAYDGGYRPDAVNTMRNQYRACVAGTKAWFARCSVGSQITNAPAPTSLGSVAHAIDVMADLVSEYSSATIDTASAARVKAGSPFASCSGIVQAWTERANNPSIPPPPLSLRQVLTELAQSSDFDVFINWSGQVAFSSDVWDFTTATQAGSLLAIAEASISSMRRWVPSIGERGAAFNRVVFEGGKMDAVSNEDVPFQGPFDLGDADIPASVRSIEIVLRQGWRPFRQQALDPVKWRSLDTVTRDRISFRTNISGLRLELGQYFRITWTRGSQVAGPYNGGGATSDGVIFQCEAITYSPTDDVVEIEAVWRDDTSTERQYLLDDETLLVRSKGAMSGNALTAGDEFVTFDGTINLTTMGVVAGDILILRDASEAADSFALNAAFRISFVVDYMQVSVVDSNGAAAVLPSAVLSNAEWSIVRGATTYPTAISDPTNYPSGGDMYGKATAAGGTYSNSETGNRLISG